MEKAEDLIKTMVVLNLMEHQIEQHMIEIQQHILEVLKKAVELDTSLVVWL